MLEALGSVAVSTTSGSFRIHGDNRPLRETLVELCQTEDYDGFVQMALVQLDLMFEQDPVARTRLQSLVQLMKEVDGLDWPAPPGLSVSKAKSLNLEAVFRDNAELARQDFPSKVRPLAGAGRTTGSRPVPLLPSNSVIRSGRPGVGAGRTTGSRPLPLIRQMADPRATGSGPV
jgi:hypothetical protein